MFVLVIFVDEVVCDCLLFVLGLDLLVLVDFVGCVEVVFSINGVL